VVAAPLKTEGDFSTQAAEVWGNDIVSEPVTRSWAEEVPVPAPVSGGTTQPVPYSTSDDWATQVSILFSIVTSLSERPQGIPCFVGLVLPSGQKLILGILATITLKVVPFLACALFSVLLQFFKCIMEVMLCESFQHCLRSVSITSVVPKWWYH
jgi:hypothetical protein